MEQLGILLYGYEKDTAEKIGRALEKTLEQDIIVLGASKRDDEIVSAVLNSPDATAFANHEEPFCMFLGFDNDQIQTALSSFPGDGIIRPIFCGLTPSNINWTVSHLHEHLCEEKRQWATAKEES
jgi:hypothetical protein